MVWLQQKWQLCEYTDLYDNVAVLFSLPLLISLHFPPPLQRFQPLLKENREYLLAPKAWASWGVWGMPPPPPGNFANLVFLKRHIHFDIFFVVFSKFFILITDVFKLFFAVVNPSFQSQTGRFLSLLLHHGHFEKPWIIVKFVSARHKCIQWGATLVWALLYSLLSSQTL